MYIVYFNVFILGSYIFADFVCIHIPTCMFSCMYSYMYIVYFEVQCIYCEGDVLQILCVHKNFTVHTPTWEECSVQTATIEIQP